MTEGFLSSRSAMAQYSVIWRHDEGVSAKQHADYLDELAWTTGTWLQEAVDQGVQRMGGLWSAADTVESDLLGEINQHWLTVRDRVKWFTGRKSIVNLVQLYVLSDDDKPLIIHGFPGVGKSSVIAKVAAEVLCYRQGDMSLLCSLRCDAML